MTLDSAAGLPLQTRNNSEGKGAFGGKKLKGLWQSISGENPIPAAGLRAANREENGWGSNLRCFQPRLHVHNVVAHCIKHQVTHRVQLQLAHDIGAVGLRRLDAQA